MNPWLILIAVVAVGISGTGGFFYGKHVESVELRSAQLDMALAYAGDIVRKQGENDKLAGELAHKESEQKPRDRIITKEVLRYVEVTPPADRVVLPGTWRVRHDAAATGEPPDAAGLASGATEPVEDAVAIETVADNYEGCRESIRKLSGWQLWWSDIGSKGCSMKMASSDTGK